MRRHLSAEVITLENAKGPKNTQRPSNGLEESMSDAVQTTGKGGGWAGLAGLFDLGRVGECGSMLLVGVCVCVYTSMCL